MKQCPPKRHSRDILSELMVNLSQGIEENLVNYTVQTTLHPPHAKIMQRK